MKNNKKRIFISYSWDTDSEEIVNKLEKVLTSRGVDFVLDKKDLGFKGKIRSFMEQLGQGEMILTIVDDKYLKSSNCMFELVEISKKGNFYDRVVPLLLESAKIFDPVDRIEYIKYWEEKISTLTESMRSVDPANLQGIREDLDLYTEIRATIAKLADILKNMNTLTPDIHLKSNFNYILSEILNKFPDLEFGKKEIDPSNYNYADVNDATFQTSKLDLKFESEGDIGKGLKLGGLYQGFPLKTVSSIWERYYYDGWVKSGWLYISPQSGISHAVCFYKVHLKDDGSGYIHILDAANPSHKIWFETKTRFRKEELFSWSENNTALWHFRWD